MKHIQDFQGGISSDGRIVVLELISTEAKRLSIAFDNQQISRLVPMLAGLAQMAFEKLPESKRADLEKSLRTTGKPVEASSAKLAPGSDGGMLLTVRVGTMDLAFRLPAEAKERMGKELASLGGVKPEPKA